MSRVGDISSHVMTTPGKEMKVLFGILLVLVFAQPSHSQGVTQVPGGSYFPKPGQNFWGNNITLRTAFLPSGAKKSWIDFEVVLPAGVLQKYYAFVHNISGTVASSSTRIRLQIWRPLDVQNYQYKLQWEKIVTVSTTSNTGIFYTWTLADSEKFRTQQGDRIGWTNEGTFGAISFQYVEGHRTYFRKVDDPNQFPRVGNDYTFDNIHLPTIFSIGVEIDPNVPGATGATGPTGPPGPKGDTGATERFLATTTSTAESSETSVIPKIQLDNAVSRPVQRLGRDVPSSALQVDFSNDIVIKFGPIESHTVIVTTNVTTDQYTKTLTLPTWYQVQGLVQFTYQAIPYCPSFFENVAHCGRKQASQNLSLNKSGPRNPPTSETTYVTHLGTTSGSPVGHVTSKKNVKKTVKFIIGADQSCKLKTEGYCNGPLKSGTYFVKLRALKRNDDGSILVLDGPYSLPLKVGLQDISRPWLLGVIIGLAAVAGLVVIGSVTVIVLWKKTHRMQQETGRAVKEVHDMMQMHPEGDYADCASPHLHSEGQRNSGEENDSYEAVNDNNTYETLKDKNTYETLKDKNTYEPLKDKTTYETLIKDKDTYETLNI